MMKLLCFRCWRTSDVRLVGASESGPPQSIPCASDRTRGAIGPPCHPSAPGLLASQETIKAVVQRVAPLN